MGLKDTILAADDRDFEDHHVPEWGVKVRVKGLSGTDRDAYEARMVAIRKTSKGEDVEMRMQDFRTRLVVKCLVDPDTDERVFAEGEVGKLGAKSGMVIDRLYDVARRLSGMDDKSLEAARGNSQTGQSGSSTSVSPGTST